MGYSKRSRDARERIGGFAIVRGPGRAFSLTAPDPPIPRANSLIWNVGVLPGAVLGIAGTLCLGALQFTTDPLVRVLWTAVAATALVGLALLSRVLVARLGKRRAAVFADLALAAVEFGEHLTEQRPKQKKKRRRPR